MKKIIAIVFAILTIASLTACGNKATTNGNEYSQRRKYSCRGNTHLQCD